MVESCYLDANIKSVICKLEKVCTSLVKYQNTIDELPKVDIKPSSFSRGFWNIDFQ